MANEAVTRLANVPWAIGTSVDLYPRTSDQHLPDLPPTGVAKLSSSVVAADRSLTFGPGFPDGSYWAVAPLTAGQRDYQYVALMLQTPVPLPVQIAGPQGPPGPVGPPGPQGMVWKGDWQPAVTYQIGDAVAYGGVSWAATNVSPPGTIPPISPTIWTLMADKGQTGPQGPAGTPQVMNMAAYSLASPVSQAPGEALNLIPTRVAYNGDPAAFFTDAGQRVNARDAGLYLVTAMVLGGAGAANLNARVIVLTTIIQGAVMPLASVRGAPDPASRPVSTSVGTLAFSAGSAVRVNAYSDAVPLGGSLTITNLAGYAGGGP